MTPSYKICTVQGAPSFDALPVAQIAYYPLEKRDYKPYAQCILCTNGEELILRMWAFEVSPPAGSSLRCVLYLYPESPNSALCIDIPAGGGSLLSLLERGKPLGAPVSLEAKPLGGEDLQGVYWGATVTLGREMLALGGKVSLQPGELIAGNFYKLCLSEPHVHMGSFFPAEFPDTPYQRSSMGEMWLVSY